ncbi:MAG: glycerol-3-phosphate 1-O-acyltransferase PlsY [Phycisphaeraceae bacterium]|nr:glycerol-3-phosphate 1-O-acyltransferase PlsY [Phycisphaeraceae bacterium]
MTPVQWFIAVCFAFLCGSFPTGYIIGRARGVDIRKLGSGNIGATNVGRVFGRRAWLLCFSGDFFKGFGPVLGAGVVSGIAGRWSPPLDQALFWCAALAAAVFGHMFTPWLGFKGGKGVATALGSLLGFFPILTFSGIAALGVFIVVLKLWRYVSLASICATAGLPVFVLIQTGVTLFLRPDDMDKSPAISAGLSVAALTAVISSFMIYRHRSNIARLRAGTEPKTGSEHVVAPAQ